MAQELLHRPDVVAILHQVRREGVAKGVAGRALRDPGGEDGFLHRPLKRGLVQVVAIPQAAVEVACRAHRREHELPRPLARRARVLPTQRAWKGDEPAATGDIAQVLSPTTLEMTHQLLAIR